VKLSQLSTSALDALIDRHIAATNKLWAEKRRRQGVESIESQIACLPKKQRLFLLALWKAPNKRMTINALAKRVWNETDDPNTQVKPETIRKFIQRLETSIEEFKIPLFIDCVKLKNGDVYGYKLTLKKN
jgi:DNA-binding response OmpR family regulator